MEQFQESLCFSSCLILSMCRFIQHPCFVLQNSLGARVCVEEVPAERTSGSCLSSFSIERQVGGVFSLAEKMISLGVFKACCKSIAVNTNIHQDHTQNHCWQKVVRF